MNSYAKPNDAGSLPEAFGYFEDFYIAGAVTTTNTFIITAISSGTCVTTAANGGWATLSGAATTDNSGSQLQLAGAHACTTGKPIVFKTRLSVSDATEIDVFAGLFPVDASIEASLPADGIYFVKADGGTTISCVTRVSSSSTTTALTAAQFTAAASTNYRLGIGVFPNGSDSTVEFVIDGVVVARHVGVSLPATSVFLTPTIAMQSGTASGTITAAVDYVSGYQAR